MKHILQHLFNKNSVQEVEPSALEDMARDYPYFALGQYFYTRALQADKPPVYVNQYQKALLYFNNPLWLKYQLEQPESTIYPDFLSRENTEPVDTAEFTTGLPGSSPDLMDDVVLHQEKDYEEREDSQIHSRGFDNIHRDLSQSSSEISNRFQAPPQESAVPENRLSEHANESAHVIQSESSLQAAEPDITEDHEAVPGDLPLQAYHTVDYFASQGIKLSQDALSNDKLGKQMKSFTEWLKTMRRLPEPIVEEVLEKINDSDVAKYAAHSLEEKEVVTEAMAEVLSKQGKTARAIEVYQKLSLLNLHKSAYFAAKIEGLKQH